MERNFLSLYQEYAGEQTDAPANFHQAVGLTILSAAAGPNVWLAQGSQKIFPNLWVMILGESSFSRKSSSIAIGRHLLHHHNSKIILPDEFSPEAMIANLATQPQGIFFFPEFSTFLRALTKDYMSGAKEMLTNLFDYHQEYKRVLRGTSYSLCEPCLSIMAGSTFDWFSKNFQEGDLEGGFLVRFLYMPGEAKKKWLALPPKADPVKKELLRKELLTISQITGEMSFAKVRDPYTEWHRKHEEEASTVLARHSAFLARLETYCKKLCMLYTLALNKSTTVSPEAFECAVQMVNIFKHHYLNLCEEEFAFSKDAKKLQKIKKLIRANGNGGITHQQLLRSSHITAHEFSRLIETLLQTGEITRTSEKNTQGGRPTVRYLAGETGV